MREIKFRGKTINGNEWIYGPTISQGTIKRKADKWFMEVAENKWKGLQFNTLGQYTGLNDKNGKEIYEGDIVKSISGKIGYVIFLQQEMGYVVVWDNCDTRLGHRNRGGSYECDGSIEVIGNIYDNHELLKK